MKFKDYALNEASSVKDKLDFIVKNQAGLNDWDVEDLWLTVARDKFKKETGFYPTATRYKWEISDLGWELKDTDKMSYDDIVKAFKQFQGASADSPQEMEEKTAFTHLLQYAEWDGKGTFKRIANHDLNSLFRFLRYIVYGKLDQNLKQANDIIDRMRPTEGFYRGVDDFKNEKFPEIGNITMTRYKNGKIAIKGLKKKDQDHITKIVNMVSKYGKR